MSALDRALMALHRLSVAVETSRSMGASPFFPVGVDALEFVASRIESLANEVCPHVASVAEIQAREDAEREATR